MIIFLVRSINKPLKALAEKSIKVGEGDYTIAFASVNRDAIGQLTNSLGNMVARSREMLLDIVTSSQSLSASSIRLAGISEQIVSNADATTTIANETARHAPEVKDNSRGVRNAADELARMSDQLALLVSKFKI